MTEPRRIQQTVIGRFGNCQSACLAMLLGCDLADVPNFNDPDPGYFGARQEAWLCRRGLWLITLAKPVEGVPWPPAAGYYIAAGLSPRGYLHSVVYHAGALWHDPHPDGGGIADVEQVDLILTCDFQPPGGECERAAAIVDTWLHRRRDAGMPVPATLAAIAREIRGERVVTPQDIRHRLAEFYEPGDVDKWMLAPHPMLEGRSAASVIAEGRIHEVDSILQLLESGAYI